MNLSAPPGAPVDIKDPRIRVTIADVAMRFASDGPMYGMIFLVGVLALRGTTTSMESILGAAFALQARSHPPQPFDKLTGIARSAGAAVVALLLVGALHLALSSRPPARQVLAGDVPAFSVVK